MNHVLSRVSSTYCFQSLYFFFFFFTPATSLLFSCIFKTRGLRCRKVREFSFTIYFSFCFFIYFLTFSLATHDGSLNFKRGPTRWVGGR